MKSFSWILALAVPLAMSPLAFVACSSDTTTPQPIVDASTKDVASGNDAALDALSDGSSSDAGTTDACTSPPKLFPPTEAGVFCPFGRTDAGKAEYCTPITDVCCLSPSADAGDSVCSKPGSCPTGFATWACSSPKECGGNEVCCLQAGPLEPEPKCPGYQRTKGFSSITCVPSAKCTGTVDAGKFVDDLYVACETPADCPQGKTCTAIKTTGTSIGVCL